MRRLCLFLILASLAIFLYSCDRDSMPSQIGTFSEGEYYGSFETSFISPYSVNQMIDQRGVVSFLFHDSAFYYDGEIRYSSDDIYPLNIESRGDYKFKNDTIVFTNKEFSENMLQLSSYFTCEYAGNTLYLYKENPSGKLSLTLTKR